MLSDLNAIQQEAKFLPKFVSTPITLTQRIASDETPGVGMLEVSRFVPCPAEVRGAAYQFWPPQLEVIRPGYDDTEAIRVICNASAPTSSRVMLRMDIGYSKCVRHQANLGVSMTSTERRDDSQTDRSIIAALKRAIDKVVVGDLKVVVANEAKYTATATTLFRENTAANRVLQPGTMTLALREAYTVKAQSDARVLHQTELRAAMARQEVARKRSCVRLPPASVKKLRKDALSGLIRRNNAIIAVLLLMLIASVWGPAAWSAAMSACTRIYRMSEARVYQRRILGINESSASDFVAQ